MKRLWKDFRTNLMYWRFRNITRNRLRLQSWWARRRQLSPVPTARPYRPRGGATFVHRRTEKRSWIALFIMVLLLTGLGVVGKYLAISGSLIYALSALVVVGAI